MEFIKTDIEGLLILEPKIFKDSRGYFFESYSRREFEANGIFMDFVQDNQSKSVKGTLRGLHFQAIRPQDKLVHVISGEIFDVAVDLRPFSPTFKKWFACKLSAENAKQLLVPKGFAHGFCVLSETAEVCYKCTDFYFPEHELGIRWNDPELAIEWPVENPILSKRDSESPFFNQLDFSLHTPENGFQIIKRSGDQK